MADVFDLVIIGAGPGGYVAAVRAAQHGLKVAVVEARTTKALGGTCLNVGCIPSKALLDSSELYDVAQHKLSRHGVKVSGVSLDLATMMARKTAVVKSLTDGIAFLFKKNKITAYFGTGTLTAPGTVEVNTEGTKTTLAAKHVLLATGSDPIELPFLKYDGTFVVSSTEALAFDTVPKELIVVGAGYIGLELGSVWARLGSKVTVVEYLSRILPPCDGEIATAMQKILTKQGLNFQLGQKVTGATVKGKRVTLTAEAAEGGAKSTYEADKILVAVGRKPRTDAFTKAGVALHPKTGRVVVDSRFQTNLPGVYALGDLTDGPMLAHKASDEAIAFADMLAGQKPHVDYNTIPSAIYTWPEVASVGPTEEQLKATGVGIKVGKFPFGPNGRAKAMDEPDGFVKVIADAKTDRLLAVHILGPRASDLIAEAVTVMSYHGSAEDLARCIHGHPTLSETVMEAARHAWLGMALHS